MRIFLAIVLVLSATTPAYGDCNSGDYGKCGEQPPKTDRHEPQKPEPKPDPKK